MLAVYLFSFYFYSVIRIINYKRGNLNNVLKAFINFGFDAEIIDNPDKVRSSDAVVLPGVGAFGDAIETMNSTGFSDAVREFIKSGKPFLGICLGLQLLFEESEEFGSNKGLGIVKGKVKRFKNSDLKIPHIGWNQAELVKSSPYFRGVESGAYFYFVHSYYVAPDDKNVILTSTRYGEEFVSSIQFDNVIATQFHIEKSQENGLHIIQNFGELCVNHARS